MSAFIVSKRHIDVLVAAAEIATGKPGYSPLHWRNGADAGRQFPGPVSEDALGRLLWAENVKSVAARYPDAQDGTRPGPIGFRQADALEYRATVLWRRPSVVEVLKALDCYEYQSCETDDWRQSEACAICEALRTRLITMLPGYEAAPWEWA